MDNLTEMLAQQNKWQNDLGYDFNAMSVEERVAYAKEMSIHMTQELHESLYELPFFKPWKNYSALTSFEQAFDEGFEGYCMLRKAKDEVVDMWHFFMNYMLALGMTADDLYTGYKEKNAENYARQEEGYTHDKSYRG